ncbi:C-type lectin 37Da-like [Ceratitis capitata]|uniref:C-type lectin 37Da-like n=1 Tax=Ceratitis capitata TaxID=7213 RepID=UPI000A0F73C8|nr:C-type lectin 37Da-like [Ceratitis capitata]
MGDIIKPQAIFNVTVLNIYINGTTEQQQQQQSVEWPVKEYFLVKHTKLDWYGAAYYCKHADARLVQIESNEEKRKLKEFLKQNKAATKSYWTAGNTIEDSYFWRWGIGGVQITFTDWAKSEPQIKGDEACLLLKEQSLQWSAVNCTTTNYAICERKTDRQRTIIGRILTQLRGLEANQINVY